MTEADKKIMLFHHAVYKMYDEVRKGIEVAIEGDLIRFYFEKAGFNPQKGETARGEFHKWIEHLKAIDKVDCLYVLEGDKYVFKQTVEEKSDLPVLMNEFEPILKLIQYYKYNPAIDKLTIQMIVPRSLQLDIDKVKTFFDHDATLHYESTGGTWFEGTVKNEMLKRMVMSYIFKANEPEKSVKKEQKKLDY